MTVSSSSLAVAHDIPWLDLVRFHRAVVERAEDSYWSLEAQDAASERWTSLDGFDLPSFDGPWPLESEAMTSAAWRRQLQLGRIDTIHLGGPGFLGFAKVGTGYAPRWQPLVSREVQIVAGEAGSELRPVGDDWTLSPPVHALIERRDVRPDLEPDALSARVLAEARELHAREGTAPGRAVVEALLTLVPEIAERLVFDPGDRFTTPPAPWMLFAPPTRVGPYNQHLVRDYEAMERWLRAAPPGEVGGLTLLRPSGEPRVERYPEVLPFIPLNAAQERAVGAMLAGQPVTVVSGPPGCGKSQVVVSLLLNAWARGQSVLFASNNNKAVDVVRERLRPFDAEQPVAIRAGNATVNNVASALRRIAQAAGSHRALRTDVQSLREERVTLRIERQQLLQQLESGVPQRTAEAVEAALRTYSAQLTIRVAVAARESALHSSLTLLAGQPVHAERAGELVEATRRWLAEVATLQAMVGEDAAERARCSAEVARAGEELVAALARAGVTPDAGDAGVPVEQIAEARDRVGAWLTAARRALGERPLAALAPLDWDTAHERWASREEALAGAAALGQLADEVSAAIARVTTVVEAVGELQQREARAWADLREVGWPDHVRVPRVDAAAVQRWVTAWGRFISTPRGAFAVKGALARRTIRRELEACEEAFRDGIPLEVWRRIGPLSDDARNGLADVLERLVRHLDVCPRLEAALAERAELEAALAPLRTAIAPYGTVGVADLLDVDAWRSVPPLLRARATQATAAAEAWRRRAEHDEAVNALVALGAMWLDELRASATLEGWRAVAGSEVDAVVSALVRTPTPDAAAAVVSALQTDVVDALHEALDDAVRCDRERREAAARRAAVPTPADRIAQAWRVRPAEAIVLAAPGEAWPDAGAHEARVAQVEAWQVEWRHHVEVERPERLRRADFERDLAVGRLRESVELLPSSGEAQALRTRIDQVLDAPEVGWPVGELRERFLPFTPERIRLRLAAVDDALSATAMREARSMWAERLGSEASALNAVDRLYQVAGTNGQGDLAAHPEHFRRALPIAPIWITTAQHTRSIPLAPELFDLVVIDEASQCTLTNLLPMLFRARHLVVIGDPQQLPAINVVSGAEERLLADQFDVRSYVSEFGHDRRDVYTVAREALPGAAADVVMLDEHYRSDPLIIGFANRHVYQHRLRLRRGPGRALAHGVEPGVHRVHVPGEARRLNGGSWANEREARVVVERVRALVVAGVAAESIGVVTPFAGQKGRIRSLLEAAGLPVHVDTAFGFQGDERDVIVFSAVAGPGMLPGSMNWVEHPPNLLNVALTRAKDALFVVANFDHCAQQRGLLRDLTLYLADVDALRASHPAEVALFSWMMMEGWSPTVHDTVGKHRVSFVLAGRPGVRVAVIVRALTYPEAPRTEEEQARAATLEAAGYRVVEAVARDVIETPSAVLQRIREAM